MQESKKLERQIQVSKVAEMVKNKRLVNTSTTRLLKYSTTLNNRFFKFIKELHQIQSYRLSNKTIEKGVDFSEPRLTRLN